MAFSYPWPPPSPSWSMYRWGIVQADPEFVCARPPFGKIPPSSPTPKSDQLFPSPSAFGFDLWFFEGVWGEAHQRRLLLRSSSSSWQNKLANICPFLSLWPPGVPQRPPFRHTNERTNEREDEARGETLLSSTHFYYSSHCLDILNTFTYNRGSWLGYRNMIFQWIFCAQFN